MPKKRFTSQYSKPQSTVHPSLSSSSAANSASSSSSRNYLPHLAPRHAQLLSDFQTLADRDATPSVNDLIQSLRRTQVKPHERPTSTVTTPTLPPQIRQLLSQPETPAPRPRARDRRRFDINGRRIPPGPAPPRSWLEGPNNTPIKARSRTDERVYPHDVEHLPGVGFQNARGEERSKLRGTVDGSVSFSTPQRGGRSLQDMCLRRMASDWEFLKQYERHNLAYLPTGVRMLLLSYIAVYGPEEGVGFEALKHLLMPPNDEDDEMYDPGENNDSFVRLDLSGSAGRSVSFKQLTELVEKPTRVAEENADSWEESFTRSLSPPIPHLTHLSLSHPPSTISWPRLLSFAKHVPTLTHLSLAYWPVPALTPNSTTAVMSSSYGKDVQYGGTNYYSHSIDADFREAAAILRRLATTLYGLEYLDLTACSSWLPALHWKGDGETGIEWALHWPKLCVLRVFSDLSLSADSEFVDVATYVEACAAQLRLESAIMVMRRPRNGKGKGGGRGRWVDVQRDDGAVYDGLWKGAREGEERRKRRLLDTLKEMERGVRIRGSEEDAEITALGDGGHGNAWEE